MVCVALFFFVCAGAGNAEETSRSDFGVVRHDIKKIFAEINERANRYNGCHELFPGWSEEEVLNYLEVLRLIAIDYDLTQEGIARYGVNYEINPVIRGLHNTGVNTGSLLLPVSAGLYAIVKKMGPTGRRLLLLLIGAVEYWAISTHAPHGIAPDPRYVPTMTILHIRF